MLQQARGSASGCCQPVGQAPPRRQAAADDGWPPGGPRAGAQRDSGPIPLQPPPGPPLPAQFQVSSCARPVPRRHLSRARGAARSSPAPEAPPALPVSRRQRRSGLHLPAPCSPGLCRGSGTRRLCRGSGTRRLCIALKMGQQPETGLAFDKRAQSKDVVVSIVSYIDPCKQFISIYFSPPNVTGVCNFA